MLAEEVLHGSLFHLVLEKLSLVINGETQFPYIWGRMDVVATKLIMLLYFIDLQVRLARYLNIYPECFFESHET